MFLIFFSIRWRSSSRLTFPAGIFQTTELCFERRRNHLLTGYGLDNWQYATILLIEDIILWGVVSVKLSSQSFYRIHYKRFSIWNQVCDLVRFISSYVSFFGTISEIFSIGHSNNAFFQWNFQKHSVKIIYAIAIIDWVCLGFPKWCIVGNAGIIAISAEKDKAKHPYIWPLAGHNTICCLKLGKIK